MRFFVPVTKDETEAEAVWEAIKKFAEDNLGWEISERRIFSIAYQHHGQDYYVEVGKPDRVSRSLCLPFWSQIPILSVRRIVVWCEVYQFW